MELRTKAGTMLGSDPFSQAHRPFGMGQVQVDGTLRLSGSVVTVGGFDGVHRGHQALLRQVTASARRLDVPSVVYTFDQPPKVFFGRAVRIIPPEEKVRRLSLFGVDHVVMARFDAFYAERPAEDFLQELGRLEPLELWVGADFRFGQGRKGDLVLLGRYFDLRIMSEVTCPSGERVSSTRLRALLAAGRNADARELHGWPDAGCMSSTVM